MVDNVFLLLLLTMIKGDGDDDGDDDDGGDDGDYVYDDVHVVGVILLMVLSKLDDLAFTI